jgi:lipopolysaccharide/colanic/teichoic acid biosynthesis glycosyltransferase
MTVAKKSCIAREDRLKRLFDFSAALVVLFLLAPVLLVLAFAVWREDRGSPFYRGVRVARGGGDFRMLKFRSMRADAWKTGVNSTADGDGRITRTGAWLRRFKLDELPQIWNVLVGDMSFVGPRPQVRTDAELYTQEEARMLEIRPGVTDLASIVFADEGDILTGSPDPDLLYNQIIRPWKSRLALLYMERRSFVVDCRVLLLTALALVSRRRALDGVGRMLAEWDADPMLRAMARRAQPLMAYPPPGAVEVLAEYRPRQWQAVNA